MRDPLACTSFSCVAGSSVRAWDGRGEQSLCAAVPSISVRQVAEWMGHANPTTTELVYTHLYAKGDHDDEMAALGSLATGTHPSHGGKVIPLRR